VAAGNKGSELKVGRLNGDRVGAMRCLVASQVQIGAVHFGTGGLWLSVIGPIGVIDVIADWQVIGCSGGAAHWQGKLCLGSCCGHCCLNALAFAPETSRPSTVTAFFKHKLRSWIDGPVVAFAWPANVFR